MEGKFIVKVHKGYRWVVAICDSNLKGQRFEEGEKQLDVSTRFFEGDLVEEEELRNVIERAVGEDAMFFIVGEDSVEFVKSIGLIDAGGVSKIAGISFAMVLL